MSNNVANASTPGYKQDRLPEEVGKPIDLMRWAVDAQGRSVGSITLGPQVGISQLDLTPGPMQETCNPLDLAIAGTGFFTVQAADGTDALHPRRRLSRRHRRLAAGRDGSAVLDTNGQPIDFPSAPMSRSPPTAPCWPAATTVAQLQLVDFAPGTAADQGRQRHVHRADGAQGQPAAGAQLYQGYLEGSNVDMTESMVSTMSLVRAYEANQKMLQMQDETLKSTVNEVGKA